MLCAGRSCSESSWLYRGEKQARCTRVTGHYEALARNKFCLLTPSSNLSLAIAKHRYCCHVADEHWPMNSRDHVMYTIISLHFAISEDNHLYHRQQWQFVQFICLQPITHSICIHLYVKILIRINVFHCVIFLTGDFHNRLTHICYGTHRCMPVAVVVKVCWKTCKRSFIHAMSEMKWTRHQDSGVEE